MPKHKTRTPATQRTRPIAKRQNGGAKPVTTGVIAIAGFGTRFLPVTKAIPKEMLPIINKPIVQYIVEEMVNSGITDITFIVTARQKPVVEKYFGRSPEIEQHLKTKQKTQALKDVRALSALAKFSFAVQKQSDRLYGTGAALRAAKKLVGNKPFVLALGDDLVKSKVPFSRQLINSYQQHGHPIIGAQEVPRSETYRYGILETTPQHRITKIIEKPRPGQTQARLAILGRYLLTKDIWPALEQIDVNHLGEVCLTDAFDIIIQTQEMRALKITGGQWYTTGDPKNYLATVLAYAQDNPDLKPVLKSFK